MSKSNEKNASSTPPVKPGDAPNPAASEAEFLAQQAADAKAAITRTIAQIGADLGNAVSPSGAMHSHPWLTLGASAVAGFVAAAAVVPSKEQQALRKLAKIEEALRPKKHRRIDEYLDDEEAGDSKRSKSRQPGLAAAIVQGVFKTLQPILLSTISAAAARPSQEEMQAAAAAEDQGAASA